MEITYKRYRSCNYVILQEQEKKSASTYQVPVLLENQIPGLLSCTLQKVNGEELFYYEITGCQNVQRLYENKKFQKQDLEELYLAVLQVMEKLEEYLLTGDFLFLHPMYIYKNMDQGSYAFLWFPFGDSTIQKEWRTLTEYLLPKIDHGDSCAVTMGYGVYKEVMEDSIHIEAIKKQIYTKEEEKKTKRTEAEEIPFFREEENQKERERQKLLDEFYREEEPEETSPYGVFAGIAFGVLGIVGFFVFRHYRLLTAGYIAVLFGVCILICTLLFGVWYLWKKTKPKVSYSPKQPERRFSEEPEGFEENQIQSRNWKEEEPEVIAWETERRKPAESGRTVLLEEEPNSQSYLKESSGYSDQIYTIGKESILIGKNKECVDIWLDVPTVSRIHAKIIHREQGDYLVDLNSRNGTLLNGEYLDPEMEYLLENESFIVFAQVKFCYYCPEKEKKINLDTNISEQRSCQNIADIHS